MSGILVVLQQQALNQRNPNFARINFGSPRRRKAPRRA